MGPRPKAKVWVMLFLSEKFYFRITRNFLIFTAGLLTIQSLKASRNKRVYIKLDLSIPEKQRTIELTPELVDSEVERF